MAQLTNANQTTREPTVLGASLIHLARKMATQYPPHHCTIDEVCERLRLADIVDRELTEVLAAAFVVGLVAGGNDPYRTPEAAMWVALREAGLLD